MTTIQRTTLAAALAASAAACGAASTNPPPAAPTAKALPVFVDVAAEAGLTAPNHSGKPEEKDWVVSAMGGGAVVLDYDQDGLMDIVVVDGTMLTQEGRLEYADDARTRLYHNDGGLRFTDVTKKAGIDIQAFGFGGAACDYDGDGFPDFYVCCWGRSKLMHNRGDGTFEDATGRAGVAGAEGDMSTSCCWGDVDGDGMPDLYVATYVDQWELIRRLAAEHRPGRSAQWHGIDVYVGPAGLVPQKDHLYLGTQSGTFRDVSETRLVDQVGGRKGARYGFQPVMTDVDGDGDLDIYVANDTQPNYLWINDGHGVFVDHAMDAGAAVDADAHEQAGMGVDVADVDQDGRMDVVVTNFSHDHNTLYLNRTGRGRVLAFEDVSKQCNFVRPSYLRLSWGVRLFDYDCDGNLDCFVACGHVYGEIDGFGATTGTTYRQQCLLLHGSGGPTPMFEDVTQRGGPGLQIRRSWRGAAFADFDDDGDQDVFVTALNDVPALLRNDGGNDNAFLVFRLVGKPPLRDPCGARVVVHHPDGRPRVEELHHGASFCCDNDPRLFFGLGRNERVPQVDVKWPNGEVQTFRDVATRRFYVVDQGKAELRIDVPRGR